jgi:DNA-binding Xre family transcriptional regulator
VKTRPKSVIDKVRFALEKSSISRYEVSKQTGIDQAALSRFAAGGSLRVESIEKLCPVLGLRLMLMRVTSTRTVKRLKRRTQPQLRRSTTQRPNGRKS